MSRAYGRPAHAPRPGGAAGAETALYFAKLNHVDFAVMKAKSPSCGKGLIYDGTFTGNKIPGNGVTVELLNANGIPVFTEDELDQLPL